MFYKIAIVAGMTALLAACARPAKDDPASVPAPTPSPAPVIKQDSCPVSDLSDDQIRALVQRAREVRDETVLGAGQELRAGWLAYELAAAGVTQDRMQAALEEGKFVALVTWLGDGTQTLDLNKFRNCEEF